MPARTFSSSAASPDLSPPRFHPRPSPRPPASSHFRRGSHDDRPGESAAHATAMPPTSTQADSDYPLTAPWPPTQPRIYPDPSTIPPHWQIHPATVAPLYRDPRTYLTHASVIQANPRAPWQNPYPRTFQVQPFVAPPPSPLPHKVWILDCRACSTFLTNRGMKAVLLLRPNVPLYSTDALPVNCSAFSPESESPSYAQPPSASSPVYMTATSNYARPPTYGQSGDPTQATAPSDRTPARTCECLTQTLCCHGCGTAVGYMIVTPCQRCTSSITVNNRTTNGHRFVFYSSEITACERHYIKGERGVSPYHPPPPPTPQTIQSGLAGLTIGSSPTRSPQPGSPATSPTASTPTSMPPMSPGPGSARRTSTEYLPTPPPEAESPFAPNARIVPSLSSSAAAQGPSARSRARAFSRSGMGTDDARSGLSGVPPNVQPIPYVPSFIRDASLALQQQQQSAQGSTAPVSTIPSSPSAHSHSRARAASASAVAPGNGGPAHHHHLHFARPYAPGRALLPPPPHATVPPSPAPAPAPAPARAPAPAPEPLKAGEVLYWHHLLRSGEIPAVSEDPRARADANNGDDDAAGRHVLPSGIVVAGR